MRRMNALWRVSVLLAFVEILTSATCAPPANEIYDLGRASRLLPGGNEQTKVIVYSVISFKVGVF